MRPFEVALAFALVLSLVVLAVPRLHAVRWTGGVILVTVALAVVQALIEGSRWQLMPAYAVLTIFVVVWFVLSLPATSTVAEPLLRYRIVAGFAIFLGVLSIGLAVALPAVLPVFQLPPPSGPYAIGTLTYHWTDDTRHEAFSSEPDRQRELMAQIWYPARKESSSSHAPYVADAAEVMHAQAQLHRYPDFALQHLQYVPTHATTAAPAAGDQPQYPALIFLEGLTGYRQQNTFQVEELVSHGYIVIALDQPGAAASVVFPDGRHIDITDQAPHIQALIDQSITPSDIAPQYNGHSFPEGIIPYFAQDVSFALDRVASINAKDPYGVLTGKLDLRHVGAFGMSLGAIVAAEACLHDARLQACLLMDAWMSADVVQQGLKQPSMWITRPADTMRLERQRAGGWAEEDILLTLRTMRAVYERMPRAGYYLQIPDLFHIDLTDLDLLSPLLPTLGVSGPIGSQRAHDIVNTYSVAFFDKYLAGKSVPLLDGTAQQLPGVMLETRGP